MNVRQWYIACLLKYRGYIFEIVSNVSSVSNPLLHSRLLSREGPLLSISQTNGKDPSEKTPLSIHPSNIKGELG